MTDDLGKKYADAMFTPHELTEQDEETIAALLRTGDAARAIGLRRVEEMLSSVVGHRDRAGEREPYCPECDLSLDRALRIVRELRRGEDR